MDASRLLAVAYQIGGGTLNLPGAANAVVELQASVRPVTNIVVHRDGTVTERQKSTRIPFPGKEVSGLRYCMALLG